MSLAAPQTLPRLFVIGDSISIQYGPHLERFLQGIYHYDRKRNSGSRKAEADLDQAAGANGGDSDRVLAYLRTRRAENPIEADVLVLNCGLHDIKVEGTGPRQVPLDEYENNLKEILEESRQGGWKLIWVRTTPVVDEIHNRRASFQRHGADVVAYNAVADRVMGEAGVPVVDLFSFTEKFLPEGYCDHVHFTEEVRVAQAAFLAGALSLSRPR